MNHTISFLFFIITVTTTLNGATPTRGLRQIPDTQTPLALEFATSSEKLMHQKTSVFLLIFNTNPAIEQFARYLRNDLEFSQQLMIDLQKTHVICPADRPLSKIYLEQSGYSYSLTIECINNTTIRVILTDVESEEELLNTTQTIVANDLVTCSHNLAGSIMTILTGSTPPFASTIAYCKQLDQHHKVICCSDITGQVEKTVIKNATLNVAPRWHSAKPVLFFSQFTADKARLVSHHMITGKRHVVCAYDGLSMQPSFSYDATQVALCLTKNENTQIFLYDQTLCKTLRRKVFKQLTHNNGNNSSPCMLPNGNIVFCSDFETGIPQIYLLDLSQRKHTVTRLTNDNIYSAAPTYCEKTDSIVYTKLCDGTFQLFYKKLDSPIEEQLTFDAGDKVDPAYSPCGKYIAFTYDTKFHRNNAGDATPSKHVPQIAIFNIMNKDVYKKESLARGKTHTMDYTIITHDNTPKSFPAWASYAAY